MLRYNIDFVIWVLGMWKFVEILIWVFNHLHIGWRG